MLTIKGIVFDFDGTLIASNQLKHDAFFQLLPPSPDVSRVIQGVLAEINEESRFVIIDTILRRLGGRSDQEIILESRSLADRYNEVVLAGAKMCPEIENAGSVLASLNPRYRLYVSSNTPDEPLKEIISFRGWIDYFDGVFGYPHKKPRTLRNIMDRDKITPSEIAVVGDGESDRRSAAEAGCLFIPVTDHFNLEDISEIVAAGVH